VGLVGAVSMARTVNDDKLSREILKTAADEPKARLTQTPNAWHPPCFDPSSTLEAAMILPEIARRWVNAFADALARGAIVRATVAFGACSAPHAKVDPVACHSSTHQRASPVGP